VARVFLSVGSNLGDHLAYLRQAVTILRSMPDVEFLDASALYRTEPWEHRPGQQADEDTWFFNCVMSIETTLEPTDLLGDARLGVAELLGRRGQRAQLVDGEEAAQLVQRKHRFLLEMT